MTKSVRAYFYLIPNPNPNLKDGVLNGAEFVRALASLGVSLDAADALRLVLALAQVTLQACLVPYVSHRCLGVSLDAANALRLVLALAQVTYQVSLVPFMSEPKSFKSLAQIASTYPRNL